MDKIDAKLKEIHDNMPEVEWMIHKGILRTQGGSMIEKYIEIMSKYLCGLTNITYKTHQIIEEINLPLIAQELHALRYEIVEEVIEEWEKEMEPPLYAFIPFPDWLNSKKEE